MLRRVGALAVAIVLAALPSLNRICLTGCDLEKSATARADRSTAADTTEKKSGGDKNCPLHDNQASSQEPSSAPHQPSPPSPCQHQQELASADYAKSRSLALDTHSSLSTVTAATIAGPIVAVTGTPVANRPPILPRRSSNLFILRI
jgi:hypothetical protein